MKKIKWLIMILTIVMGLNSQSILAAEITSNEQELTDYLVEVSTTRGFEVNQEDINIFLAWDEMTIADFQTIDELKNYAGEIINADLSNLTSIYEEYSLDQTSLTQLLNEYGEELSDYVFIKDLAMSLDFYYSLEDTSSGEVDPDFESKLTTYLADISAIRGFEVTKENLESFLSNYLRTISDFKTVDELSNYLGDVIKSDLSNLEYLETEYELTNEDILDLLEENGKSINDFIFVDDLEDYIISSFDSMLSDFDPELLTEMLTELDLSEEEVQNIENHFLALEEYLSSEEVQAQLEALVDRIFSIYGEILESSMEDEEYILTDANINEFVSIYDEVLSIFKLNLSMKLMGNGIATPITFRDLFKVEDLEELNGSDLFIAFYDLNGTLLADIVLKDEFYNEQLGDIIDKADEVLDVNTENNSVKTVKGGELPKTATNYIPMAFVCLLFTVMGFALYRKVRNDKDETLKVQK